MPTCDSSPNLPKVAYILAGGKSTRFGMNKALVPIDGTPQIQRLAHQLRADAWTIVAVSQQLGQFDSLGVPTIADLQPDQGPVAGVFSAMLDFHARGQSMVPWALLLTCDLWEWKPAWTDLLLAEPSVPGAEPGLMRYFGSSGFDPFPCVVHRDALAQMQRAYEQGDRSMRNLHARLGASAISVPLPNGLRPESFNTREELHRLKDRSPGANGEDSSHC